MPYTKEQDGSFTVTSRSGSKHKWTVTPDMRACDCPKFKFILKGKAPCHHITEVLGGEKPTETGIIKFEADQYDNTMSIDQFIDKFGDNQFDWLLAQYEIVLNKGKVFKLK